MSNDTDLYALFCACFPLVSSRTKLGIDIKPADSTGFRVPTQQLWLTFNHIPLMCWFFFFFLKGTNVLVKGEEEEEELNNVYVTFEYLRFFLPSQRKTEIDFF